MGEKETTESRLYVLDGMRLVAALMVVSWHLVAGHASQAWGENTQTLFAPIHPMSRYGWLGVELFFLISGFVICMSSWGRSVGSFAISRIARLFPAYWVAVILTTIVLAIWPTYQKPLSTVDTLANMTMVQELLGVDYLDLSYWTLLVELLFYVLFAIVVLRGVNYKRVVVFCVVWLGFSVAAPGFGNAQLSLLSGARYAPYFIAGVAFYLIHRFKSSFLLWALVGLSWVVALVRMKTEIHSYDAAFRPSALAVTLFFALMSAVALGWFGWVKWRWVATAGALTYPLYLLHQVIGLTVIKELSPRVQAWPLLAAVVVGLLVLAWLMNVIVERPGSRFLKRSLNRSLEAFQGRAVRYTVKPQPEPAKDQPVTSRSA